MSYHGTRVLVTGGAGFIGSFLAQRLVAEGADVAVTIRPGSNPWRLASVIDRVRVLEIDLANPSSCERLCQSWVPELIFNLGSLVRTQQSLDALDAVWEGNFLVAKNVFHAAAAAGVRKCVQVGTVEEYGHAMVPFVETAREEPISPYSLGKAMATHLALVTDKLTAMRVAAVRMAATFGPAQGFVMLTPNVIRACMERKDFPTNPGEQMRDLMFVDDAVNGLLAVGASPAADGEIINIGTGTMQTMKAVMTRINELMGNPITIQFGAISYRPLDTKVFYMDVSKAERLLGWRAAADFDAALAQTVAWYREHWDVAERELLSHERHARV